MFFKNIQAKKFQEKNRHLNFIYGLGIDSINTFFKFDSKLNYKKKTFVDQNITIKGILRVYKELLWKKKN